MDRCRRHPPSRVEGRHEPVALTRRDVLRASAAAVLAARTARPAPTRTAVAWSREVRPGPGPKGAVCLRDGTVLCARTVGAPDGVLVECLRSSDGAQTWHRLSTIASRPPGADVGDGCLVEMPDGKVLYSYRDNRGQGADVEYAIRVAVSADGGTSWALHSTVATGPGAKGGLWASFLLNSRAGLQCYYDDERSPWEAGFQRHQWVTLRTWDPASGAWVRPVTVSRAHDATHLSRDGMPAVVELPDGQLLCVLESVDVRPPHCGVVLAVTSDDGGRTWSWQRLERRLVYQPADRRFGAFSPWIVRVGRDRIVCVFGLNEGRDTPRAPGTPTTDLGLDVASVESDDGGRTWSPPTLIYAGTHRNALPGVFALGAGAETLVCQWLDADRGFLTCEGRP